MAGFRYLNPYENVIFKSKVRRKGRQATSVWICIPTVSSDGRKNNGNRRVQGVRCFGCGQFSDHLSKTCPYAVARQPCYLCRQCEYRTSSQFPKLTSGGGYASPGHNSV